MSWCVVSSLQKHETGKLCGNRSAENTFKIALGSCFHISCLKIVLVLDMIWGNLASGWQTDSVYCSHVVRVALTYCKPIKKHTILILYYEYFCEK